MAVARETTSVGEGPLFRAKHLLLKGEGDEGRRKERGRFRVLEKPSRRSPKKPVFNLGETVERVLYLRNNISGPMRGGKSQRKERSNRYKIRRVNRVGKNLLIESTTLLSRQRKAKPT